MVDLSTHCGQDKESGIVREAGIVGFKKSIKLGSKLLVLQNR